MVETPFQGRCPPKPHISERSKPFSLRKPPTENAEAGVGPGDVRAGDVSVRWEQNEPHRILLDHQVPRISLKEGRRQLNLCVTGVITASEPLKGDVR